MSPVGKPPSKPGRARSSDRSEFPRNLSSYCRRRIVAVVLKALLIWMLIAVAEVLHGILWVRLLNRRVGDNHARQIAVFSASAIILLIAWFWQSWISVAIRRNEGLCSYWHGGMWPGQAPCPIFSLQHASDSP